MPRCWIGTWWFDHAVILCWRLRAEDNGWEFAIHGLAQYYKMTKKPEALEMAIDIFRWMNTYAHDAEYGGYYEVLNRDGSPIARNPDKPSGSPLTGLKEFNSSLHIMEAFTELYHVWHDPELKEHLLEMYVLFRDTFIHPDGYLQLYFS